MNERKNGYYTGKNNLYYPSVSLVKGSAGNSGGLLQWAAKQSAFGVFLAKPITVEEAGEMGVAAVQTETRRVQDFGTMVHDGIEKFLSKQNFSVDDWPKEALTALKTFINFYNALNFKVICLEKSFVSDAHQFGGRTDLGCELTAQQAQAITPYLASSSEPPAVGNVIVDYKTGNFYSKPHSVQLAAYKVGLEEATGVKYNGGLVINIKRDQPDKVVCYYFSESDLIDAFNNGFIPAYQCWKFYDAPKWWHKQWRKE